MSYLEEVKQYIKDIKELKSTLESYENIPIRNMIICVADYIKSTDIISKLAGATEEDVMKIPEDLIKELNECNNYFQNLLTTLMSGLDLIRKRG